MTEFMELVERLQRQRGDVMRDCDLTADAAWEPTWNPYAGKITPSWHITRDARLRMGNLP